MLTLKDVIYQVHNDILEYKQLNGGINYLTIYISITIKNLLPLYITIYLLILKLKFASFFFFFVIIIM